MHTTQHKGKAWCQSSSACGQGEPANAITQPALTALQVQVHDSALVQVVQPLGDVKQHAPAAASEGGVRTSRLRVGRGQGEQVIQPLGDVKQHAPAAAGAGQHAVAQGSWAEREQADCVAS